MTDVAEPQRQYPRLGEAGRGCHHLRIELKDIAAWTFHLDESRDAGLAVGFDLRHKPELLHVGGEFLQLDLRLELIAEMQQRLAVGGLQHDVVTVVAEG
jgi:hypothetical protein